MSYEHLVTYIIKAVEAVGIAIMVFGGLAALIAFGVAALDPQRRQNSYDQLRRTFGRCILLGLEVLIVADIVRTVVVDQTFQSVVVLGVIVLIRIVLSFSLDVEIDGTWPWNRRRTGYPNMNRDGTPRRLTLRVWQLPTQPTTDQARTPRPVPALT